MMTKKSEHGVTPQPQVQQRIQQIGMVDTSTKRGEDPTEQREAELHNGQPPTQALTQR